MPSLDTQIDVFEYCNTVLGLELVDHCIIMKTSLCCCRIKLSFNCYRVIEVLAREFFKLSNEYRKLWKSVLNYSKRKLKKSFNHKYPI